MKLIVLLIFYASNVFAKIGPTEIQDLEQMCRRGNSNACLKLKNAMKRDGYAIVKQKDTPFIFPSESFNKVFRSCKKEAKLTRARALNQIKPIALRVILKTVRLGFQADVNKYNRMRSRPHDQKKIAGLYKKIRETKLEIRRVEKNILIAKTIRPLVTGMDLNKYCLCRHKRRLRLYGVGPHDQTSQSLLKYLTEVEPTLTDVSTVILCIEQS